MYAAPEERRQGKVVSTLSRESKGMITRALAMRQTRYPADDSHPASVLNVGRPSDDPPKWVSSNLNPEIGGEIALPTDPAATALPRSRDENERRASGLCGVPKSVVLGIDVDCEAEVDGGSETGSPPELLGRFDEDMARSFFTSSCLV